MFGFGLWVKLFVVRPFSLVSCVIDRIECVVVVGGTNKFSGDHVREALAMK